MEEARERAIATIRSIERKKKVRWSGVKVEGLHTNQLVALAQSMDAKASHKKGKKKKR